MKNTDRCMIGQPDLQNLQRKQTKGGEPESGEANLAELGQRKPAAACGSSLKTDDSRQINRTVREAKGM